MDKIANINNLTSIAEFLQAIKMYYLAVEEFLTSNLLLLNLIHVASHIKKEHDIYSFVSRNILCNKN